MSDDLKFSIDDYWGTRKPIDGTTQKPIRHHTEETKRKISAAMKGRKKTKAHIKAAGEAHKAKKRKYVCSDQTKRKLSIAAMQFWDERKKAKTPDL